MREFDIFILPTFKNSGISTYLLVYFFPQNQPIPAKAVTNNQHSHLKILKDDSYLERYYIVIRLISVRNTFFIVLLLKYAAQIQDILLFYPYLPEVYVLISLLKRN